MTDSSLNDAAQRHLCRIDDVADGGALEVMAHVEGELTSVLLLRHGDDVRAFHNVCPHAGRALNWAPGRFLIDGGLVICAAHGASFEVPGGRCVGGPCRGSQLQALATHTVNGALVLSDPLGASKQD